MPTPKPKAPIITSGVSRGVIANWPPPPPKNPEPKTWATTMAKLHPSAMPTAAPIKPTITDSPKNMASTVRLFMPMAFRMPISRVRSINETIMMFMMPTPATSSEMAAMPPRNS